MSFLGPHNVQEEKTQHHGLPIARSRSFLGVIKDLVTAPLTWFADSEGYDSEEISGKRRRPVQSNSQDASQGNPSRNKRPRLNNPGSHTRSGYLDPPVQLFQPSGASHSSHPLPFFPPHSSRRSSSVFTPTTTIQRSHRNRHSASPIMNPPPFGISRALSRESPNPLDLSGDVTMYPVSREASMNSTVSQDSIPVRRETSLPVTGTPFRMRTSLTPQPSGSNFGPKIKPRERDPSEPPPLASLMSNPIFVKAPPETQQPRSTLPQPIVTLGSIAESQRSLHVRQHSSLFGSSSGSTSHIANSYRPINAAEKVLHELDVYKTPLLPTRLQTASALPDMFKPKKSHSLVTMAERDDRSRLGVSGKKMTKGKEEVNATKPYAGEGAIKRLLSRQMMDEGQEEKEKNKLDSVLMEGESSGDRQPGHIIRTSLRGAQVESNSQLGEEDGPMLPPIPPPILEPQSSRIPGPERSSLRVGRTKTSRNHIVRPVARPLNRFSATFDDDDDQMSEDSGKSKDILLPEEKIPVIDASNDFSFANEMTQIQHDLSNAKEPPMTSLPFSLAKPSATNDTPIPPLSSVKETEQYAITTHPEPPNERTTSQSISVATSLSSTPPPAPPISISKPTSESRNFGASENASTSNTTPKDSIPNFFATSSVFTKPSVSVALSSFGGSTSPAPIKDTENPLWDGGKELETIRAAHPVSQPPIPLSLEPKPSTFGTFEKPPPPLPGPVDNAFGAPPTPGSSPALFSTSGRSTLGNEGNSAISLSGAPLMPIEPAASPLSLGAPPNPAETPAASQPLLAFGTPRGGPTEESEGNPSLKLSTDVSIPPSIFGGSSVTASQFKPPENETKTISNPSKLFGSLVSPAPATSLIDQQPKLTSGTSFLFGQPANVTQVEPTSSPSPFSYGAAPSTPPAGTDKKPVFSFNSSASSALTPGFPSSAPAGSSSVSDVSSKPFIFGATNVPPDRALTPPKNEDQEFRMDESPTRDMQLNGNGKQVAESRPSLFSFTTPPTSVPFNQTASSPFPINAGSANIFTTKTENKTEQKPAAIFGGFGQNQTTTPFGQKAAESEQPKNNSSAFSFQATPTTSTARPFTFGAPATNNLFSQTAPQSGSAPNSPSPFSQPSTFSFTAPASAPSFTFGSSQPASPAAAGSPNLPPGSPGVFTFGASPTTQSASPFGVPVPAPPPTGTLFTIGAAPPPPPGGRPIKRFPTRRTKR